MVQDTGMSGVELLALYGEDNELLGKMSIRKRLSKFGKKAIRFTPQYWMYKGAKAGVKRIRRKKMSGDDSRVGFDHDALGVDVYYPQLIGAAKKKKAKARKKKFLPGLTKVVKKVGKVTSPVTGGIARAFVPPSVVTALSKIDPTKKKPSTKALVKELEKKEVVPVTSESMKIDPKKIAIIGGSAVGGLILIKILTAPRRG